MASRLSGTVRGSFALGTFVWPSPGHVKFLRATWAQLLTFAPGGALGLGPLIQGLGLVPLVRRTPFLGSLGWHPCSGTSGLRAIRLGFVGFLILGGLLVVAQIDYF